MLGADDPMEAHKIDSPAIAARGASADAIEGVMSFLEKRPAVFPLKVSSDMPDLYPWWEDAASIDAPARGRALEPGDRVPDHALAMSKLR